MSGKNRIFPFFLFVWISSTPATLNPARPDQFIVWNVGQGLWTTWSSVNSCYHFDMGGEFWPVNPVRGECAEKHNRIFLSHWDWDHIGLAAKAARLLRRICLEEPPLAPMEKKSKLELLESLPQCREPLVGLNPRKSVQIRNLFPPPDFSQFSRRENDNSRVWIVAQKFLVPGDSPTSREKIWAESPAARVLVAGHHGSRTSTGAELLRRLPSLRLALISARKKRYGHPHTQTMARLKSAAIATLRTEDWGTIRVEIGRVETGRVETGK